MWLFGTLPLRGDSRRVDSANAVLWITGRYHLRDIKLSLDHLGVSDS